MVLSFDEWVSQNNPSADAEYAKGWPDEWRVGVKLEKPHRGPLLGLFDPSKRIGGNQPEMLRHVLDRISRPAPPTIAWSRGRGAR